MQWPKLLTIAGLLVLACVLATANIWFAAARSTIPLRLDAEVQSKRRLMEKHRGVDDVYLLYLNRQRTLQVDKAIFESVAAGSRIRKTAWSRQFEHDGEVVDLNWSADFRGMLKTMPGIIVVILGTLLGLQISQRSRKRRERSRGQREDDEVGS